MRSSAHGRSYLLSVARWAFLLSTIGLALSAACLSLAAGSSLPAPVTLDGVGGVVPGMTLAQVARRWGTRVEPGAEEISPGCRTASVRKSAVRGYALFERGRFAAVWFERGVWTPSGIRIGSTRAALVRAYGSRLAWKRHAYEHGGWYAFLTRRTSPRWHIRFDVSRFGRVSRIGFGARAVAYVEGCA
jgi:hypothetical protein